MAKFKVHVVLSDGLDFVQFAPGDEVPDWALDLVGDHCLALPEPDMADGGRILAAADTAELLANGEAESVTSSTLPNFTGAPASKTRTPRAPKAK